MGAQNRTAERGGVVVFFVIGILLAAILAGGLAFAKWRSDMVATTEQTTNDISKTEQTQSETVETAPSESIPTAPEPTTPTQPVPQVERPVASASAPQTGPQVMAVAETGPTEVIAGLAATGLLTAAVLTFRQSYLRLSDPKA